MVERDRRLARAADRLCGEHHRCSGGATVCTLLPVTIHDQPVAFGLGGALERVRPLRQRYAALLRRAALSVPQRHPPAAASTDS
jgi:hypothetical protein